MEESLSMRHIVLWTLVLLGLPGIAVAEGTIGPAAGQSSPGNEPAIERTGTSAPAAPQAFDLSIDPTQLPSWHDRPGGPVAIGTDRGQRYSGAAPDAADRGLSFGVEVKPRSRVGNLARETETDAPGLEDNLQRLIDRGTLGVRGRYRF